MIDTASSQAITLDGACHCGAVQFTVTLTEGFASARRCTCSICRMRGAIAVTSTPADFKLRSGSDKLATYRFNTKTAEHHFCTNCGVYTHHKRRSNPSQLGVNVACLEGVSPFDFEEVVVYDGQRHPADSKTQTTYRAGVLRFVPASDG
ncbi:MAG TPA: GFA family protein [Sphingomicrobium sp.]|nr:GFA family protein [Sphingomicrobium sp.]